MSGDILDGIRIEPAGGRARESWHAVATVAMLGACLLLFVLAIIKTEQTDCESRGGTRDGAMAECVGDGPRQLRCAGDLAFYRYGDPHRVPEWDGYCQ